MIDAKALQQKLTELATELDVVGAAVGVYLDGQEIYAFHGVTSVENPLPVDADTYFQFGSTGKTYTATAIMRLVESGQVDLDAPVRTYVPELRLRDETVARQVTVLQLLNHTAGWDGDMMDDTGDGDDARAEYVRRMERLQQIAPLGTTVSYNNASLCLAGRLIEKVTGSTYETAIHDLLLEPLGMHRTLFFAKDVMTRRFAVGHNRHDDGRITVARPWPIPRSCAPAGGMSATAADQIAWARFHLGDGTAPDGTRILSAETLRRMQQPTADMSGSALGDYVGISWLLRDLQGTLVAGHGGTTNGQYSEFTMVPDRRFALIAMTNSGPNGPELNRALEKWAYEHYLGVTDVEPERLQLGEEALSLFAGHFETIASTAEIVVEGTRLVVHVQLKPDALAALREQGDDSPDEQPPIPLDLLAGPGDQYVVADGPAKGMRGYFSRDAEGRVSGIHLGGRLASRVSAPV